MDSLSPAANVTSSHATPLLTPTLSPWEQHWHDYVAALDFSTRLDLWIATLPIICYWTLSAIYNYLDTAPFAQKYKLWPKPQYTNSVTKAHVVHWVLVQHGVMFLVNLVLIVFDPNMCVKPPQSLTRQVLTFLLGMVVFDSWQYSIHRLMHEVPYLYRKIHSVHHQLLDVYSFGALYNHPLEAFLLDTVGAVVTMFATNCSCEVSTCLFTFATCKTVFDHCGFRWPLNPVYHLFANNSAYHDVHHNLKGVKLNYSQPFFTVWDRLLGTYANPEEFNTVKEKKDS